jgi:hypothetical protein
VCRHPEIQRVQNHLRKQQGAQKNTSLFSQACLLLATDFQGGLDEY